MRFKDRAVLITGGSQGIGLEIARRFVDQGAFVTITGRDPANLAIAATQLGRHCLAIAGSAGDDAHARDAIEQTVAKFGTLHVLVNNAAYVPPTLPLLDMPIDELDASYRLNLRAPLVWSKLACDAGLVAANGCIINVASLGGLTLQSGMGAYGATKAGLIHLTRYLAAECGPAVRVNAVAPGLIRTEQSRRAWDGNETRIAATTPAGRIGSAGDVAEAVLFLADGNISAWITGETLVVDGGASVQWGRIRPPR